MVEEAREGVCPGATADRHITAEGTSQLSPSKCLSRVQLEQDQAALLTSASLIYRKVQKMEVLRTPAFLGENHNP
ncbi:hypothetical protein ATANTOWER_009798 [Ataeniobius toweri]|uniref:Uncharacterized protein n=1 Tax=Ataeniobius toweri TaxID=208326 RepID=A0ABU7BFB6_9TELE|nr:hypothetical protein [Ataeniobius toweri]